MGFFGFGRRKMRDVETLAQYPGTTRRSRMRPATPGSGSGLRNVAYAEYAGGEFVPLSREEAITVPAVASARWLICHPLSRQPLVAYDNEVRLANQPRYLSFTGGQTPWQFRTSDTLDDLFFESWSLWRIERSLTEGWELETVDGFRWIGAPIAASHVPLERWDFDDADGILLDGEPMPEDEACLFRSPMDAFLMAGRRTVHGARLLDEEWRKALKGVPVMEIQQTEDIELQDSADADADPDAAAAFDEARQIVDDYVESLAPGGHGVVFVPYGYKLEAHGERNGQLFTDGRNFQVLDVARHAAIPPHLMGASQVAASLTYSTSETGRSDYRDLVQVAWAMALEARLSMDDMSRPGVSVRVDLSDLTTTPDPGTGPNTED